MIVGYTVYARSDKQKIDIAYNIGLAPVSDVKQTEFPRMKTVMKNFVVYRGVIIACIITGLVLIFLFRSNPGKNFWYGFGMALAMQAVLMIGADYFAEQKGKT